MTLSKELQWAYTYHRSYGHPAAIALSKARDDAAAGRKHYGGRKPSIEFDPPGAAYGERHCRWTEHAASGLRLVGFADEIDKSIRHTGWYTDEYGDRETVRGVVYRLPARNGVSRYAYGYADPWNSGAAFLSFDPCDDEQDAARWADHMAERMAEEEREYQANFSAGQRAAEAQNTIASCREHTRAIVREMKAARRQGLAGSSAICARLRTDIEQLREESAEAYNAILKAEGAADTGSDGFKDGLASI